MTRTCAILFLFTAGAAAEDTPKAVSRADKLTAIIKAHADAQAAFLKAVQALGDTAEDRTKFEDLGKSLKSGYEERLSAALGLASADPKSDDAMAALNWILTIPPAYHTPTGVSAMQLAAEHHAANPKIGNTIACLGRRGPRDNQPKEYAAAMALVKAVAEKNPDRTARGQAFRALAQQAIFRHAVAEYKRAKDADRLAAEAETALEVVVKDYGDCPRLGRRPNAKGETLADDAGRELYAVRHLRVGKMAPDIQAESVAGPAFKLSDGRGKVVVLAFWASWCGPCMAMVPHEIKLAARLKDEPFALIGVNGDADRGQAREAAAKAKMTWPSFWDGPTDGDGPVCRAWNVREWPTVYVLDAAGVIRFKGLPAAELDKAVDELLNEMKDRKKK